MTMRQTLYDFCRKNGKEYLLAEWDKEKDAPLTLRDISYGSDRKM